MPSPTCSEKLLRDALLRDERERQQQLSSPTRPFHPGRRFSHTPISSSDFEATRAYQQQQQQQQSPTSYQLSSPIRPSRRSSSTSTSPSPLRMKRRRESLGPPSHSTANFSPTPTPTNDTNLRRNQSLQHTNRYGSAYHGQGEQARSDMASSDAGSSQIMMRGTDGNEVRDEQGDWPWTRGRQGIRNGTGSMVSDSPSASYSQSKSTSSQTPTRTMPNNQHNHSPYYSPSSPNTPYSAVSPSSASLNRARPETNTNPALPAPRRNNSSPSTLPVSLSRIQPTQKSPVRLSLRNADEGAARLPTPPPSPNGTRAKYSQRKQEGGLELRMPTQGPRPSQQRHRDMTITQSPTSLKKSGDGTSSESCSTRTSVSSVSNLHGGYSCSSDSSLDGPLSPPHFAHHDDQRSPSTPPFNARKASTQCRAIEGYVSFASVEGLGEPPLVRDEFDGEDGRGKGRKGSVPFLPLGALSAALGWKRFLGGGGEERPGVEARVVV